ncbi:MAG: hypothetical protein HC902_02050 [Calothrix sp. SM1_5_4]|nr:hypothetical protein [Calothrix sp. SM1_5_4]
MSFRARDDIHLARRLWHFFGVMTMVVLYWIMTPQRAAIVCSAVSAFMILFDVCRLRSRRLNIFFTWLFGPFLRESERGRLAGSTFMMAGVTLCVWLYPKNVVLLTLLFFAVADPLASYFGIRYGKDKLVGNKSLQGSAAAFIACFVVAFAFFLTFDLMRERLFLACLMSALIGAVSELFPVWKLDDNFVFPVLGSTLLAGLFYIFGGL